MVYAEDNIKNWSEESVIYPMPATVQRHMNEENVVFWVIRYKGTIILEKCAQNSSKNTP